MLPGYGLQPFVFVSVIEPLIRKSTAFDKSGISGPEHQSLIGCLYLSEHECISSQIGMVIFYLLTVGISNHPTWVSMVEFSMIKFEMLKRFF